nr:hypothetical protein [uncultured bacterium]
MLTSPFMAPDHNRFLPKGDTSLFFLKPTNLLKKNHAFEMLQLYNENMLGCICRLRVYRVRLLTGKNVPIK